MAYWHGQLIERDTRTHGHDPAASRYRTTFAQALGKHHEKAKTPRRQTKVSRCKARGHARRLFWDKVPGPNGRLDDRQF